MPDASVDEKVGGLSEEECRGLFAPLLGRHRRLALAVSGGGDSLALMWLVARWAKGLDKPPRLHVLTVDHGLREDSARVAQEVCRRAGELGLPCDVLRWEGEKPRTGIEEAARAARYRLLARWCAQKRAALVVAHTREDQAETFLMRLGRGSGVDGLSGMAPMSLAPHVSLPVPLLRPLLAVGRARLRAVLEEAGWNWHEDPANTDERHERARVRRLLSLLEGEGITAAAIAVSAARLGRAREALEREVATFLRSKVAIHPLGMARVPRGPFDDLAPETALRVLAELSGRLGGHGRRLMDLAGVERLLAWWRAGSEAARTLGGARLQRRARELLLGREPGRVGAPTRISAATDGIVWDGRFALRFENLREEVQVMALEQALAAELAHDAPARSAQTPDFVWRAQPAVVGDARLLALPAIGWVGQDAPFAALRAQPLFLMRPPAHQRTRQP